MPEKYSHVELINQYSGLLFMVGVSVLGMVARVLIKDEPVNYRRLAGELILAGIGGLTLYAAGMLQGLTFMELLLLGGLSGLGGVRVVEIAGQVWLAVTKTRGGL